jgi:uncharacterized membrane protein
MNGLYSIIRSTLIGGMLFLLPFGIILVALEKVNEKLAPLGVMLHSTIFPSSQSVLGPAIFSLLVLFLIAFLAGTFVRTGQGRRLFVKLEKATLGRIPLYAYLRPALDDLAGSSIGTDRAAAANIVEVRAGDVTTLGVLIEMTPDNRAVVFFPDAPSGMSGTVAIVASDKVFPTTMTRAEFFLALRGFGTGIGRKSFATGESLAP